jgi:hypothetical protein
MEGYCTTTTCVHYTVREDADWMLAIVKACGLMYCVCFIVMSADCSCSPRFYTSRQ